MSEETLNDTPKVEAPKADTASNEVEPPKSGVDSLPDWAQQEIRALRKEAASYRTKAKEVEDSGKSELQKAIEAAADAQRQITELRTENTRTRVMKEHGLPDELADFIRGDEDEMRQAAQKLAGLAQQRQEKKPLQKSPVEALQAGGDAVTAEVKDFDPVKLADDLFNSRSLI